MSIGSISCEAYNAKMEGALKCVCNGPEADMRIAVC